MHALNRGSHGTRIAITSLLPGFYRETATGNVTVKKTKNSGSMHCQQ